MRAVVAVTDACTVVCVACVCGESWTCVCVLVAVVWVVWVV